MSNGTQRLQLALKSAAVTLHRPEFDPGSIDGKRGPKTRAAQRAYAAWFMLQPQGIDISAYQPEKAIHWPTVAQTAAFVVARTSASLTTDPTYQEHIDQAKKHNLLTGAYHFFAPWRNAVHQAELFAAQWAKAPTDFCVLDAEALAPKAKPGEPPPRLCTQTELIEAMASCLLEIKRRTGKTAIIYSYAAFVRAHSLAGFFANAYRLWLADYREGPASSPPDWVPLFHQYAGDGGVQAGVGVPCDKNVFLGGDLAELRKLAA